MRASVSALWRSKDERWTGIRFGTGLRIALISCAAVFFLGIFAAYYIARLPRAVKGVLDVVLTLPMVLPPTVVGYFLLLLFGAKRPLGIFFLEHFGVKLVMTGTAPSSLPLWWLFR